MDQVLIDIYRQLVVEYHASADDIVEDPQLRNQFLAKSRETVGDLSERELLHSLTYLRRQGRLPPSRGLLRAKPRTPKSVREKQPHERI